MVNFSFFAPQNIMINSVDKRLKKLRNKKMIKEEDFLTELKNYNLINALIYIANFYHKIINKDRNLRTFMYNDESLNYIYRVDVLAKLAHLFLKSGANNYRQKNIDTYANLTCLHDIARNLLEDEIRVPTTDKTLLNKMIAIFTEQIQLQKNIKYSICRNYLLYKKDFDIDFKNATGLSIKEYFVCSFVIITLFIYGNPFGYKEQLLKIINELEMNCFNIDSCIKILTFLSINYEKYRELTKETLYISPLQTHPIIVTKSRSKDFYVVPNPPLLLEKIYNGTFYDVENTYNKINDFRQKFGITFENYVGWFLKHKKCCKNSVKIIPENEILYKKNNTIAKFADFSVIDNNITYIIEVKSSSIPVKEIYSDNLDNFIETHIIQAYKQIITKIKDIDNYQELSFLKNKNIRPIIVFRHVPLICSSLFIDKIEERLKKYCQIHKNDNFIETYLSNNKIPILDIEDFEIFWLNRNNIDINMIYNEALNNPKESFQSILKKNKNITDIEVIFDDVYNEIFKDISPQRLKEARKIKKCKY